MSPSPCGAVGASRSSALKTTAVESALADTMKFSRVVVVGGALVSCMLLALLMQESRSGPKEAEGVILIDQDRALAGNTIPGDQTRFPVSISRPVSYRLASDLVVGPASGVVITADDVNLDLNGFTLLDPGALDRPAAGRMAYPSCRACGEGGCCEPCIAERQPSAGRKLCPAIELKCR